jgi:hypothetical protein
MGSETVPWTTNFNVQVYLQAGEMVSLVVEYVHDRFDASVTLEWEGPGISRQSKEKKKKGRKEEREKGRKGEGTKHIATELKQSNMHSILKEVICCACSHLCFYLGGLGTQVFTGMRSLMIFSTASSKDGDARAPIPHAQATGMSPSLPPRLPPFFIPLLSCRCPTFLSPLSPSLSLSRSLHQIVHANWHVPV